MLALAIIRADGIATGGILVAIVPIYVRTFIVIYNEHWRCSFTRLQIAAYDYDAHSAFSKYSADREVRQLSDCIGENSERKKAVTNTHSDEHDSYREHRVANTIMYMIRIANSEWRIRLCIREYTFCSQAKLGLGQRVHYSHLLILQNNTVNNIAFVLVTYIYFIIYKTAVPR